MKKIADLYAEVIGILSQSRFHSVKRRFFLEIRDTQNNSSTVISIIEGMSFIRVKMFPVEELEQWFLFLQVCVLYRIQGLLQGQGVLSPSPSSLGFICLPPLSNWLSP
jgi:hypothetical protein